MALRPQFEALQDLAVAAAAASDLDQVRAAARARADKVLADAEDECARRMDAWRTAYQAALRAGWTVSTLRSDPINQPQPSPNSKRPRGPRRTRGSRSGAAPDAGAAAPAEQAAG